MNDSITKQNLELNLYWKRMNVQYHLYAASCGLSDPAMWTLYALYENGDRKPLIQNDIAEICMYPKQTVNFTITGFIKKGLLYLEPLGGARNSKAVRLTEQGKQFCEQVIRPLMKAEENALLKLTEEERKQLIHLSELQCRAVEAEIAKTLHRE